MWLVVQIVYYDGQFDDSRLNVSLACTAALAGAAIVNYTEVTELLKVPSTILPSLASHQTSRLLKSHALEVCWQRCELCLLQGVLTAVEDLQQLEKCS